MLPNDVTMYDSWISVTKLSQTKIPSVTNALQSISSKSSCDCQRITRLRPNLVFFYIRIYATVINRTGNTQHNWTLLIQSCSQTEIRGLSRRPAVPWGLILLLGQVVCGTTASICCSCGGANGAGTQLWAGTQLDWVPAQSSWYCLKARHYQPSLELLDDV